MKKIVVALASYNGERYIKEQIKSIFNQTIAINKLIINDDHSKDNTLNIINNLIFEGLPIEVNQNKTNLGYGLNFMKCISLCDFDYIFLSDQDDIWFPNKVEMMLQQIKKYPNYLCWMHDCSITDSKLNIILNSKIKNIREYGFSKNSYVMGATMVLSKSAKNYIYPYPSNIRNYGHDNWIAWVMRSTNNLKIINEVLIYYRRHENITSQGNFNSAYQTIPLKKLILRIFNKRHVLRERKSLGKKYSYFLWAKLTQKNFKNSTYQIRDSHSIQSQKIALHIRKSNFLKRIFLIIKLQKIGYYKFRSNYLSILNDLFFS